MQDIIDSTEMAFSEVVSSTVVPLNRQPQEATGVDTPIQPARVSGTSKSPMAKSARVATIRESVIDTGFSEDVASFIVRSTRDSTGAIYDSKWGIFVDWCATRKIDPLTPSPCKLADFFVHLFNEKNLATSTIKGYRAAIGGVFRSLKSPEPPILI